MNNQFKIRRVCLLLAVVTSGLPVFSQCIDREKITYGGEWDYSYIQHCPTYSFAYGGDTSKEWNANGDPIDIQRASKTTLFTKRFVEQKIKDYAGNDFFSKIKFDNVEVVYPNRYRTFKESGREDVSSVNCKAKYYFFYRFIVDSLMSYNIGIAVNSKGKIISPFKFPAAKDNKAIDTSYSYCKLIEIAKRKRKDIEPIDNITFEYDTKTKRFYWAVTEEIKNEKEGINYLNRVFIDATNLKNAKVERTHVSIVF